MSGADDPRRAHDRAVGAYERTYELIRETAASAELPGHFAQCRERHIDAIERTTAILAPDARVCEIGPAGLGLALVRELGVRLDAYDCVPWFKPVYDRFAIPWGYVDLNEPGAALGGPYDVVLLCEVIEHVARWPADVLADIRRALRPGGVLFLTTPNLHRLSNRLRMLVGRPLFADFVPERLVTAHLREYTVEELGFLLRRAGFTSVHHDYASYPDSRRPRWIQAAYRALTKAAPTLANYIVCEARWTETAGPA